MRDMAARNVIPAPSRTTISCQARLCRLGSSMLEGPEADRAEVPLHISVSPVAPRDECIVTVEADEGCVVAALQHRGIRARRHRSADATRSAERRARIAGDRGIDLVRERRTATRLRVA